MPSPQESLSPVRGRREEEAGGRLEEGGGRPLLIFAVFSDLQHRVWYTGQKWPL